MIDIHPELARLKDRLTDELLPEESKTWPLRFTNAIHEGADLSLVCPKFKLYVLQNEIDFDREAYPKVAEAVDRVIDLLERQIAGDMPMEEEWLSAEAAGWLAAAWAAAWGAAPARASALATVAAYAAGSTTAWNRMADALIRILEETK